MIASKTNLTLISAFIVVQIVIFLIFSSFKNDCDCTNQCHTPTSTIKNTTHVSQKPILVTACSINLYTQLQNFIGSCIVHEPERKIFVYDLGLSQPQIEELEMVKNVIIIPFPFDKYPPHVRNLNNNAWKPIVMVDALEKYPQIIYQDVENELRNSLDEIDKILLKHGYFYVIQEEELNKLDHLGKKTKSNEKLVMCASEVQGYVRYSAAHKLVLVCDVI